MFSLKLTQSCKFSNFESKISDEKATSIIEFIGMFTAPSSSDEPFAVIDKIDIDLHFDNLKEYLRPD